MSDSLLVDFQAAKSLIPTIVRRQNSTLQKACIELILNELDAGARNIEITIKPDRTDAKYTIIQISGNGAGLPQSFDELKETFAKLGVDDPNETDDRMFGEFHLGRTQIANFGPVVWESGRIKVECDLSQYMGIKISNREEDKPQPGTVVTARVELDGYPSTPSALAELLSTSCRLVTKAQLVFNNEVLVPDRPDWHYEGDDYSIAIEIGNNRGGWAIYHHGIYVQTLQGTSYEDPVLINITQRVQTTINRSEIMKDDPVWITVANHTNLLLDKLLSSSRKISKHVNIKSLWRRIVDNKIPLASLRRVGCLRLTNGDILSIPDVHYRYDGVVAICEKESYYTRFLRSSARAATLSLTQFSEYLEDSALAELNKVAARLNLTFSAYNPANVEVPGIVGDSDGLVAAIQNVKISALRMGKFNRLQSIFVACTRDIQREAHLRLHWYSPGRYLPQLALIDYPDVRQPVFTDQTNTIFVSSAYFKKISLRKPEQFVPLIDQILRAWLSLQAIAAGERYDGPVQDLVNEAIVAVYAPMFSEILTQLMRKE